MTGRILAAPALPLAVLLLGAALPARAQQAGPQEKSPGERLPVVKYVLPNGMTFLFLRKEGPPTVSFVTQFRAGAVDEWTGISGTAHLFEHMLFKGTPTLGTRDSAAEQRLFPREDALADSFTAEFRKGEEADTAVLARLRNRLKQLEDSGRAFVVSNELDRILTENGAVRLNASTFDDGTNYYFSLPSNRAELWFVLESDRLRHPVLREFYTERDVVMEERRLRVETQPFGLLREQFLGAAFQAHPYGRPVVGLPSDVQTLTRPEAEDYFRRFYGPNNAVVAVVGDIDTTQMRQWAARYFADIPAGEPHRPVVTQEPPQHGERRIEVEYDANPMVMIGYHVPDASHPDTPALTVLSSILTGGRTSRLVQRLVVRDQVAASISTGMMPGDRYPRLFGFSGMPIAPHTAVEIEKAVYDELDSLRRSPPTADEMQRVRNQAEAGSYARLDNAFFIAYQLAASEALWSDWARTFRDDDAIRRVTAQDVQRVVRKYFAKSNRTVATLVRPPQAQSAGGSR
ncbi:MAG TPA: pitrilysin family protein [Gemmatimonadales bacterium]|nr:pitrilysin family protein [Gemmatimonadales bacterium]